MKKTFWLSGVFACLAVLPACGGEELNGMETQKALAEPAATEALGQSSNELSVSTNYSYLPFRGGTGGQAVNISCASGYVASGIHGRAGQYIDRLGLICRALRADGSLGPSYDSMPVGGWGGSDFRIECPPGGAIVGFHGASGDYLDRLGLICSSPSAWRSGPWTYYTGAAGGGAGGGFDDKCSQGYMVNLVYTLSAGLVDGQKAQCVAIDP
jgi:hypothetical protein